MIWPPDANMLRWVIDMILLLVLAEAVYLYIRNRTGGVTPRAWLPNLISGAFLMLGMRALLVDAAWFWVVLSLTASGIAHFMEFDRHRR